MNAWNLLYSYLYAPQWYIAVSFNKCTLSKSLWIKASAKCPKCKCKKSSIIISSSTHTHICERDNNCSNSLSLLLLLLLLVLLLSAAHARERSRPHCWSFNLFEVRVRREAALLMLRWWPAFTEGRVKLFSRSWCLFFLASQQGRLTVVETVDNIAVIISKPFTLLKPWFSSYDLIHFNLTKSKPNSYCPPPGVSKLSCD